MAQVSGKVSGNVEITYRIDEPQNPGFLPQENLAGGQFPHSALIQLPALGHDRHEVVVESGDELLLFLRLLFGGVAIEAAHILQTSALGDRNVDADPAQEILQYGPDRQDSDGANHRRGQNDYPGSSTARQIGAGGAGPADEGDHRLLR